MSTRVLVLTSLSASLALVVVYVISRRSKRGGSVLTASEIAQFRREGFLVRRGFRSHAQVMVMCQEAMAAWASRKDGFDPHKSWLQNSLLPNIHHHCPSIAGYYFRGPLVDAAIQLIGPNVKGVTSQLTFKLIGNTMPFGWHQDNGYGELDPYTAVSCLTALDHVDEGNGCLWVVPRSHERGQLSSLTAEEKAAGVSIPEPAVDMTTAVPVLMRAGDVLLMHCHMLHRSGGNTSQRDRRILFLRYADADAVEVYNHRKPRLGRLVSGTTRFPEVRAFEQQGFAAAT